MNKMEKQLVVFLKYVQGSSRSPINFLRPVHLPIHTKSNILLWKKVFAVSSFDTLKTRNIDGRWLVFINVFNKPGQNLIAIVELCIVVIHIVRYSRDNTVSTVHRQPKIQRFKKRERKSLITPAMFFNTVFDIFVLLQVY